MTKAELHDLAEAGAREKIKSITRQLEGLLEEFPGLFAAATVPVLLRPAEKAGGNDWPAIVATVQEKTEDGRSSKGWTPARRAKMARLAKARFHGGGKKKAAKKKSPSPKASRNGAEPWGAFVWQRLHDYLATQPERTATMQDILKGTGSKVQATVISAVKVHPQLFVRQGPGVYHLKKMIDPADSSN